MKIPAQFLFDVLPNCSQNEDRERPSRMCCRSSLVRPSLSGFLRALTLCPCAPTSLLSPQESSLSTEQASRVWGLFCVFFSSLRCSSPTILLSF